MKTLESIIGNLSDEKLKQAFDEITEWKKVGVLKMDGIVRSVREEFNKENDTDLMIHVMDTPFLYEISKRTIARSREVYVLLADGDGTMRSIDEPFGVAVNSKEEAERYVKAGGVGYTHSYSKLTVFENHEDAIKFAFKKE